VLYLGELAVLLLDRFLLGHVVGWLKKPPRGFVKLTAQQAFYHLGA